MNFNELMCDILRVPEIHDDQKLSDFEEWDSLTELTIIALVEQNYKVYLKSSDISGNTIGGIRKLCTQ
jgi:acyl carrier protein